MSTRAYTKGMHDLGGGAWAYLQPNGTWGWSNAGLVIDGDEALLVDTLFDERLTAEMLSTMKRDAGFGADDIKTVVNTHSNGDHTFGNRLVRNAAIVASAACAKEMETEAPPAMLAEMMRNTKAMGELGAFFEEAFGPFDFAGVTLRLPDRTFSGEETVKVGDKDVKLIEVGPAHTAGDVLVHVPADRVVYTGDILFIGGTPIAWAGPVKRWIDACDRILAMDVEAIVPGHGPVTDKAGARRMQDYLVHVDRQARKRHAAGMDSWEAAQDIAIDEFRDWTDAGRIAVTVDTIYREIDGGGEHRNLVELFTRIMNLERRYAAERGA